MVPIHVVRSSNTIAKDKMSDILANWILPVGGSMAEGGGNALLVSLLRDDLSYRNGKAARLFKKCEKNPRFPAQIPKRRRVERRGARAVL